MRVEVHDSPYRWRHERRKPWQMPGEWPCSWIACQQAETRPLVAAYRLRFGVERSDNVRVHVSADERYVLYLDGNQLGRGPERGLPEHWYFETYALELAAGEHVLVAQVWSLGEQAPDAQTTVRHGFLLSPDDESYVDVLGTGRAGWQAKRLPGYSFRVPASARLTGANTAVDAAGFAWGFEKGEGDGWEPVIGQEAGTSAPAGSGRPPVHFLRPAALPAMLEKHRYGGIVRTVEDVDQQDLCRVPVTEKTNLGDRATGWQALVSGRGAVEVPAGVRRRVVVDLDDYYCAYPELVISGGAGSRIRVEWAESLYTQPVGGRKGNRDEVEGKFFRGQGDEFRPDGGKRRRFEPLWWQAGRYVQILVETADEALTINTFVLKETRYPLEMQSEFHCDDERVMRVTPIALRALQMCSHETYMDCPYYEQLMYVGDSRLEALVTFAITPDDRLARKALHVFDLSRATDGLTASSYPGTSPHTIPSFSLLWIAMVHDYALWRDDLDFVRARMPGVRSVTEGMITFLDEDRLLSPPRGWNFLDWVPEWEFGVPPGAEREPSGPLNWLLALTLMQKAELESLFGEGVLAARDRRLAEDIAIAIRDAFWDTERRLYADDLAHERFSEHAQVLAVLSGLLSRARQAQIADAMLGAPGLAPSSIYFSHYVLEALRQVGRMDALFDRLSQWFELAEQGFRTTYESTPEGRSDCHGWAAHPLFHYLASLLGVRPAEMGFRSVEITPQLGPITSAYGRMPHPRGEVEVEFVVRAGDLEGFVVLPAGVEGTLRWGMKSVPLRPGRQEVYV